MGKDGGAFFQLGWGGGGEFVGGSGAILPQKSLESRGSVMVVFNILRETFSVEKFATVFVQG